MTKKLIREGVILQRGGQRIRPQIGKLFDLTDQEIKSITQLRPQALGDVAQVETDPNSVAQKGSKADKTPGGDEL